MNKDKRGLRQVNRCPLNFIPEDSSLLSMVKTVSYSLLTFIKSTSSPHPTPAEIQELNKSRGYDKLRYERGMP